ncbi:MAG: hypothetical protein ACOX6T_16395 [Myxococcales bacterium]
MASPDSACYRFAPFDEGASDGGKAMFDCDKFVVLAGRAEGEEPSECFTAGLQSIHDAEDPLLAESAEASKVIATLEALFLMIAVEGRVMEEEEDAARSVLHAMASAELDPGEIEELLAAFAERLEAEGFGARLEAVGRLLREDPELAEATFRLCAAVVAADGREADEDNETLNALIDELHLDDDLADQILGEVRMRLSSAA